MGALRLLAIAIIGGLVTLGVFADQRERDLDVPVVPTVLGTPDAAVGTWFCTGGSGALGVASVGLDLINVGDEPATVEIIPVRDDDIVDDRVEVVAVASDRTVVNLAELAPDAAWVGAIVETGSAEIVVEQTFDGLSGTDRAPCATNTASILFAADGATRRLSDGEEMTLLLMNPFREDAVADISFDADTGPDSREAVVVPARRILAIDVTEEVTVASRVHTTVNVVSGRLVGHRVQVRNSPILRGLAVTPLTQRGAVVSVLPSVRTDLGLFDRIHVTNPSVDEVAEVDLEIVTDGSVTLDPVELTVRPGRTVVVDVATESRLATTREFSVVARSLTGVPVAVALERRVATGNETVPGTSALPAVDSAATRWVAALDGDQATIQIVNPSAEAIATVELLSVTPAGATVVQSFELGAGRSQVIDGAAFGQRAVIVVEASAPVVVGREIVGLTSRQMQSAVLLGDPVSVAQVP
ncbi:MAG: hypothetical protein AAGA90_17290 [Actinomycetota bacterium]